MRRNWIFVLLITLLSSGATLAAPTAPTGKSKKGATPAQPEPTRTVSVSVPRSIWSVDPINEREVYRRGSEIAVGITSWAPRDFRGFEANVVPGFWASRYTPLFGVGGFGGRAAAELGVGFRTLSREGSVLVNGFPVSATQRLWAVPVRLGLELMQPLPQFDLTFGVALMPTFLIIPRSSLGEGEVTAAIPAVVSARLNTDLWGLLNDRSASLGASFTFGQFKEASASALAVELGYRFFGI